MTIPIENGTCYLINTVLWKEHKLRHNVVTECLPNANRDQICKGIFLTYEQNDTTINRCCDPITYEDLGARNGTLCPKWTTCIK